MLWVQMNSHKDEIGFELIKKPFLTISYVGAALEEHIHKLQPSK